MKLKSVILLSTLLIYTTSIEGAPIPIPQSIIDAIETSTMTQELHDFVMDDSNLSDTDSDGDTVLWLSAHYSFGYFFIELYNLNPSGFFPLVNQQNNFGIMPLRAAITNSLGKKQIATIIQFLLREGAVL